MPFIFGGEGVGDFFFFLFLLQASDGTRAGTDVMEHYRRGIAFKAIPHYCEAEGGVPPMPQDRADPRVSSQRHIPSLLVALGKDRWDTGAALLARCSQPCDGMRCSPDPLWALQGVGLALDASCLLLLTRNKRVLREGERLA